MGNAKELLKLLENNDASTLVAKGGHETLPILRRIEKACREKEGEELERQAGAFLSLFPYDPAKEYLGYEPKKPTVSLELFNEIENKTLAVLKALEQDHADKKG